jgi:hypothetical protein
MKKIMGPLEEMAPDFDLITNSGENFDHSYSFTKRSGFNEFLDSWGRITARTSVATIRGTNGKHEDDGMVETLKRSGVKVLAPGVLNYLDSQHRILTANPGEELELPKLLLFGIPHPDKATILGNSEYSRDEANAEVNRQMVGLYNYYGAMRAEYKNVPALAVGHGVVSGKNTRDLEAISNSAIYSTESELALMGCDFYAWGHYHNPTEFDLIKGGYLGSFAWTFNELDYKPAFTIINWDTMEVSRHELDINVRKKYTMFPGTDLPDMTGHDIYLINNKTEWTVSDCKEKGAGFVKVETEVEIERKVRSIDVMEARTHAEKFKSVYPDATDRQLRICDKFWDEDVADGKIPEHKMITPVSVEVYGSKAFMERMGKEKVSLDLSELTDNLTMLIGPGGHGKSTLLDYISPFSVLFLQPNALISTFELADSYVKQEYKVNDKTFRMKKFFKPTLKNPSAEYFAYEVINGVETPIPGVNGNRTPYDEWCVSVFGTPRKYASFVLNTQFDDNESKFMGQAINPSVFKATNLELKALFHELAGTNFKHLELKCKEKADEFKTKLEEEQLKKAGAEESIPKKDDLDAEIESLNIDINSLETKIPGKELLISQAQESVKQIEIKEKEKAALETKKTTLEAEIADASNSTDRTRLPEKRTGCGCFGTPRNSSEKQNPSRGVFRKT